MNVWRGAWTAAGIAVCSSSALAETLPQLQMSSVSTPPQCATPGRLMVFLRERNPKLRPQFAKIAVHYMRHGEALGIRWDYAIYQMILETNALKFTGDVNWRQNNFAGLAATGGGVKGERFATVSEGVKAHLQHLMIYAGLSVADPIAERTRKVQSWRILDKWRRKIRGPVTFAHIGRKWAPSDRQYGRDIQAIADRFKRSYCNQPDPQPELLAEARGTPNTTKVAARNPLPRNGRSTLGVGVPAPSENPPAAVTSDRPSGAPVLPSGYKVLNSSATPRTTPSAADTGAQGRVRLASAAGAAAKFASPFIRPAQRAAPLPSKRPQSAAKIVKAAVIPSVTNKALPAPKDCRVWTASYGGQKAIIIRSRGQDTMNYTVLDVNQGRESREAAAYISAYARGGEKIGEFSNQTLALEKAFKLCPKG